MLELDEVELTELLDIEETEILLELLDEDLNVTSYHKSLISTHPKPIILYNGLLYHHHICISPNEDHKEQHLQ